VTQIVERPDLLTTATSHEHATDEPAIGRRDRRREDDRFLRGHGRFVDDIEHRGTLHAAFVRSPIAHGRILAIDVSAAAALPGVVAVVTGADLALDTRPQVVAQEGFTPLQTEVMPRTTVRFTGDLVAMVVAEDRYVAEDAVDLVDVDLEPLPVHLDVLEAELNTGSPVDPSLPHDLHTRRTRSYGDAATAFSEADRVVGAEFRSPRMTHVPIEPRGTLAIWDEGRAELTMYVGQQTAHMARTKLANQLGLREHQVRVISPDVGGAFGQKIPLYREDVAVAAMARRLRRPVKWIEDRTENLVSCNHARDDRVTVEAAVRTDGTITALRAQLWADFGAYAFYPPSYMIDVVGWLLPGAYRIPNYEYTINVGLTNKCPVGPMRAPMSIVTWATEGLIEAIAADLGLDPIEVRRRNLITLEEQPYDSAAGYRYEALSVRDSLDEALSQFDLTDFRRVQEAHRSQGRLLGFGVATVLEPTAYGSAWYHHALGGGSGHEAARLRIDPSGAVTVSAGINPSGQGYETTMSQVVADGLGADVEDIAVLLGDTHVVPYGMGSRGSRGAVAGHGVAFMAAQELREKVLRIAGHLCGHDPADLELSGSQIRLPGGAPLFSLAEVARVAHMEPSRLPPGEAPGLEVHKTYDPPPMTFSNACHACLVEVDEATGAVAIRRYVVVEDAGRLINPMIVDGQIMGGIGMGIGQALYEEVVYDEAGNNITATFVDYLIPTADCVPSVEIHHKETPNPHTPHGLKGMSEGPVQGSVAAVALAVQEALSHRGVTVSELPLSPRRILHLLRSSSAGDAGPTRSSEENQ
jgi:aerobic carbon-monoxide dehydrogenase large subunit